MKKKAAFSTEDQPKGQEDRPTTEARIKRGDPVNLVPQDSGLYHTIVPMKNLTFKMAPNETVIQNGGSYIVFGTDRPATLADGSGATGYQGASSIDLVVGRLASARGGKGPKEGAEVDNSYSGDAARIIISQLTNLDKSFGLAQGVSGVSPLGSGIGIKADDVRLIGRRSIKIVTGKTQGSSGDGPSGEPNSLGGWMHQPSPTIELIAGNHSEERIVWGGMFNPIERINTLQRACLGSNTLDGFKEFADVVGGLWSAVFNLALIQGGFDSLVGVNIHPWIAAAAPAKTTAALDSVISSLWQTRANATFWWWNYLEPYGYKYICSTNVKIC